LYASMLCIHIFPSKNYKIHIYFAIDSNLLCLIEIKKNVEIDIVFIKIHNFINDTEMLVIYLKIFLSRLMCISIMTAVKRQIEIT
jgi:hypothetical protein